MSSESPLISICIPAYNCEKYIGETINCLLKQSYGNLEIIVVDDGSKDATSVVLKSIQDSRLRYCLQHNKGAAAARNAAYQLSSGSYIKFMDADDLISNDAIQQQLNKIIGKPGCIASSKWGRFYKDDVSDFKLSSEKVWKDLPGIDWLIDSLIVSGANMMQPGIFLIPRDIIEKAGPWNDSLSLIDDFDFMVRVISNSKYVLFCEAAVLMYRSGLANSLSGEKSAKHMESAFNALKLGVERILEVKHDARSRQACATIYKRFAFECYPSHPFLYNQLEIEIEKLGGSDLTIIGGRFFTFLSAVIGWKRAKNLKMFFRGTA